eukprot:1161265-Pelagomonas_calceolata.AAC.1
MQSSRRRKTQGASKHAHASECNLRALFTFFESAVMQHPSALSCLLLCSTLEHASQTKQGTSNLPCWIGFYTSHPFFIIHPSKQCTVVCTNPIHLKAAPLDLYYPMHTSTPSACSPRQPLPHQLLMI